MDTKSSNQAFRERFVLIIYSFYSVAMTAVTIAFSWPSWIVPVVVIGLIANLLMYFKEYRSYQFRALCVTVCVWFNFIIYVTMSSDFAGAFATVSAIIILLTLYCIPDFTYIGTAVYSFMLFYHLAIAQDLGVTLDEEGAKIILRLATVYFVLYITHKLMKSQIASYKENLGNIQAAHEAEQSKDDFMANMSHEIRTPINTVCGISEMVLREDLGEEARQGVYDIQTAGRQLLSIVSDILDFTELSSGKMEIVPDTYNITSTLNDILNMAVAKAAGKGIEIIVDCDADIPSGLVGDEQKIRRAITNIVDNAIKFTEEGGIIITVSARREEYGANLEVSVRDTGIGIKEEALSTLFNRFSMVDSKRNRQEGGMGLGLSIAKVITNKMGGFIHVESTYGEGTTVKLVFPQKVDAEAPVVTLEHPEKCRVLLFLDTGKYNSAVVREGFAVNIRHMVAQLNTYYRHARSLEEAKNLVDREEFTHIFIAWEEYISDRQYFEELSNRIKVILILDRNHKQSIMGSRLLVVYKPFYVLTIASVLNGRYVEHLGRAVGREARFVAPSAEVLVVDDNLMNLKVVEGLLRPYKIKVFIAQSGQEALDKLETGRFDIIFMDHMMPEMDGIETFHRIKAKHGSYYQNVPIVALTANAIGGAREMFLTEGFADYVAKPIELSALERVLYKYIPDDKLEKDEGFGDAEYEVVDDIDIVPEDGINIDGINVDVGVSYCGGKMSDYIDVISTYYTIGSAKEAAIRKAAQEGDWKEYTTLVHAVKSTSYGIGAQILGNMAEKLEYASKDGNTEFIDKNGPAMLDEYRRILDAIGACKAIFPDGPSASSDDVQDGESLKDIGAGALIEELDRLSWLMDSFEIDSVQEALEELFTYKFREEPIKKILSGIPDMIANFDFISAKEKLDELRDSMR